MKLYYIRCNFEKYFTAEFAEHAENNKKLFYSAFSANSAVNFYFFLDWALAVSGTAYKDLSPMNLKFRA